jgi:hypothetical protein
MSEKRSGLPHQRKMFSKTLEFEERQELKFSKGT